MTGVTRPLRAGTRRPRSSGSGAEERGCMRSARAMLAVVAALAVAAPALVFADAESDLEKAISHKDASAAKEAIAALGNDAKAANAILKLALKLRDLDCHQELVKAIAAVKDDAGVKKLGESCHHDPSVDMRYLLVEG